MWLILGRRTQVLLFFLCLVLLILLLFMSRSLQHTIVFPPRSIIPCWRPTFDVCELDRLPPASAICIHCPTVDCFAHFSSHFNSIFHKNSIKNYKLKINSISERQWRGFSFFDSIMQILFILGVWVEVQKSSHRAHQNLLWRGFRYFSMKKLNNFSKFHSSWTCRTIFNLLFVVKVINWAIHFVLSVGPRKS